MRCLISLALEGGVDICVPPCIPRDYVHDYQPQLRLGPVAIGTLIFPVLNSKQYPRMAERAMIGRLVLRGTFQINPGMVPTNSTIQRSTSNVQHPTFKVHLDLSHHHLRSPSPTRTPDAKESSLGISTALGFDDPPRFEAQINWKDRQGTYW